MHNIVAMHRILKLFHDLNECFGKTSFREIFFEVCFIGISYITTAPGPEDSVKLINIKKVRKYYHRLVNVIKIH